VLQDNLGIDYTANLNLVGCNEGDNTNLLGILGTLTEGTVCELLNDAIGETGDLVGEVITITDGVVTGVDIQALNDLVGGIDLGLDGNLLLGPILELLGGLLGIDLDGDVINLVQALDLL